MLPAANTLTFLSRSSLNLTIVSVKMTISFTNLATKSQLNR